MLEEASCNNSCDGILKKPKEVFFFTCNVLAGKQRGFLHVTGEPRQVSPMDKPAGIIAVFGAGNYSSSIEMAMALFLENKAVIHKPHQLNEESDKLWAKILSMPCRRRDLASKVAAVGDSVMRSAFPAIDRESLRRLQG